MQTAEFFCDRCGNPATEWVRIYRHELLGGLRRGAHDMVEMDLCPECARTLRAWLERDDKEDR